MSISSALRRCVPFVLLPALCGSVWGGEPGLPEHQSFTFLNTLVVNDPEDPLFGLYHFYANDQGLDAFADGGPYPEGAMFLGVVYRIRADGSTLNEGKGAGYLVMTKDPKAEKTGGWRFYEFNPDGFLIHQDEKVACFHCHTQVKDRDYVFSRPLELGVP